MSKIINSGPKSLAQVLIAKISPLTKTQPEISGIIMVLKNLEKTHGVKLTQKQIYDALIRLQDITKTVTQTLSNHIQEQERLNREPR